MVSQNVTCPKCGHGNPTGSNECVKCGIIFAKFHEIRERDSQVETESAAQREHQEVEVIPGAGAEAVLMASETGLVKDAIDRAVADPTSEEAATEVQTAAGEAENNGRQQTVGSEALEAAAVKSDLEDQSHRETDQEAATKTLSGLDSSAHSDAGLPQSLAQASADTEVNVSTPEDQNESPAVQSNTESEPGSDGDDVLVLMDVVPQTADSSTAIQVHETADQNLTAAMRFEASAKDRQQRDWRRKLKKSMATKRDLKDIIRDYEGQSIAINYYESTEVQEAELIFVNNLFFSAYIKNQNLLYSFPLHTIISIAEKIEGGPGGKPKLPSKFPAVITVSPPSVL